MLWTPRKPLQGPLEVSTAAEMLQGKPGNLYKTCTKASLCCCLQSKMKNKTPHMNHEL